MARVGKPAAVPRGGVVGGLTEIFAKDAPTFYLKVNETEGYTGIVLNEAIEKMRSVHFRDDVVARIRVLSEGAKAQQKYKLEDFDPAT